ncbi:MULTISPECIES: extracellular solute-binding protein [unclassified Chelatococcus]|uniref:ABC transporter substrate-binding protein n=1 Tax=unclassified Chelatococcus TaxID=2638111 RepID=UPI001BD0BAF7|nr:MULTISPECIES: extracellular solute-binding protein [unclassified Chelatococcus]CAH1658433.1 putative spermidine/putrescine transport system substrate-binding protein [Hyphomicrobiales bacterium]MBS7740801.1 extracellular solute-binding protein [Chelatococcus sp. HY11]MBX3545965.1 extracellular solute-binding protein [Chelatococcus sp.]MCO5079591.1 extracellular solute-binding protein [Chelatococcus sp.]CAH1684142.1 putative spermidine/putrescine transport system substrate-binding protein [H
MTKITTSRPAAMSRRRLMQTGSGLFALGLAAPWVGRAHAAVENELIFAGTGGITQKLIEQEIFPAFAANHGGLRLTYVSSPTSENVAKLRTQRGTPSIDVIWLAGAQTYQVADEGLVAELDIGRMPNAQNIPAESRTESRSLPLGNTTAGLLYNERIFKEKGLQPPTSWFDMWDPKYRAHTGMLNIGSTSTVATLPLLAKALGSDPYDFDAAFAKLGKLRANVYDFFTASGPMDTMVQSGDLWMWSHIAARAMQYQNSGFPARFVTPKEGAVGYSASLGIVKNAPHINAAYAWLDYLYTPGVQQKLAEVIGYTPVVPGIEIAEALREFHPAPDKIFIPDMRRMQTLLPDLVQRWNREVEG